MKTTFSLLWKWVTFFIFASICFTRAEPVPRWHFALKHQNAFVVIGRMAAAGNPKEVKIDGITYLRKKMTVERILFFGGEENLRKGVRQMRELDVLVQVVKADLPGDPDVEMVDEGEGVFVAVCMAESQDIDVIGRVNSREMAVFCKSWSDELEQARQRLNKAAEELEKRAGP